MKAQSKQKRFHAPDNLEGIWQLLYPEHFINLSLKYHVKHRREEEITEVASIMRDGLLQHNSSALFQFSDHLMHYNNRRLIQFRHGVLHYNDGVLFQLRHHLMQLNNSILFQFGNIFPFMHSQSINRVSEISNIFESFYSEDGTKIDPRLILIDGAPGMGKTTLCKEIAYRWASGDLLTDSKLVFLLFLRDPAVQKLHELKDFIHYFYNFESSHLDLSKKYAEILIKEDSNDITIVMDGYDELHYKCETSVIRNIINRNILSQCRIVITSRPIASEKLQKHADVGFEILGFTKQSRSEYIQKELKDYPNKMLRLLYYLETDSDIDQLCYIPIMMTILVCTFKESGKLPTNRSELYEKFIALTISRCLQKSDAMLSEIVLSLNELPKKYCMYLRQLSEFAFNTIGSDKLIFSNMDIKRLSPDFASSSKELQGLDLFRATQHLNIANIDSCVWYNFLHSSIHEFLAGYYLNSLQGSEQFGRLKNTFFLKQYTNVWVMFIGLQKCTCDFHHFTMYTHMHGASDTSLDQMKALLHKLFLPSFTEAMSKNFVNIRGTFQFLCYKSNENFQADVTNNCPIVNFDTWSLLSVAFNWKNLFVSVCSNNNDGQLLEIYFLNKDQDYCFFNKVVSALELNKTLSVVLLSIGTLVGYRSKHHQLVNALHMNESLETVILRYGVISDDTADILSSYLMKSHCLKNLHLTNCTINEHLLVGILKASTNNSKLTGLNLNFTCYNIDTLIAKDLANVLNYFNLTYLSLGYNNLGPSVVAILQALTNNTNLQILNLNSNDMDGQVVEDLANVIRNNSSLQSLDLGNNNLGPCATKILQALKENCNIRTLNLANNKMTSQVAEDLASVIKKSTDLTELNLSTNGLKSSAAIVFKALQENVNLRKLYMNSNLMTKEVVEDLANVIEKNLYLAELYLSDNCFKSSAVVILNALKENNKLRKLYLNKNLMTEMVAEDLACVIKKNVDLEELGISDNELKSSTTLILQALEGNSKLKGLNLNGNSITGQVAENIVGVIKNNPNLEALYLSDNDLRLCAKMILRVLKEKCNLKLLNLNNTNMSEQVAEDLASVIKNNSGLAQLSLSGNDFRSSAVVIFRQLKGNTMLTILQFSCNSMTEEAAEDLANVIKNNSYLEEVFLSHISSKVSAVAILQALKQNSKLKVLNLNSNPFMGQITGHIASIIENNPNIELLALHNNNLGPSAIIILQALKLNSKLKYLNLNDNNMTGQVAEELATVISNNSSLEMIGLRNNKLGPSTTKYLQALKESFKITLLDLSDNFVTGQVAEHLADIINNNSGLEYLDLCSNDLKSSAVSVCQALKKTCEIKCLLLNGTNMTGEVVEDLAHVIKSNSDLEILDLGSNNLGSSASVVIQALTKSSMIKSLNLNNNNMTGEVAEDLVNFIKNTPGLEEVHLSDSNLKSSAVVVLQALEKSSQLKGLNLNNNHITGQAVNILADVIKNNPCLEWLYLSDNEFKSSGVGVLQALKENSKLKTLCLRDNDMTGHVAEDLAYVIKNNPNLKQLDLKNNKLGISSALILQALKNNSKLNALNLSGNNLTKKVAKDLANVIKNNSGLVELYLSGNKLMSSAVVILQALQENCELKALHLQNNNMTGQIAEDLANVIKNNFGLEELYLCHNKLNSSVTVILQALQKNSQLKSLGLNNNRLSVMGQLVNDLATVVKKNLGLENLSLSDNRLNTSVIVILEALKENCQLKTLRLQNINMTGQVAEHLANVIKNNPYLEVLNLGNNDLGPSASIILQTLAKRSLIKELSLTRNNLTEQVAEDLANVIRYNSDLKELRLSDNNLKSSTVVILTALKDNSQLQMLPISWNYSANLKVLELSNNSISPIEVVHLASVVANINSLQALMFDGLAFNVKEMFQFNFFLPNKQKFVLKNDNSFDGNEIFDTVCLEVWRLHSVNDIKCLYGIRNYFTTTITRIPPFLIETNQSLSDLLSDTKQLEQRLSLLDSANIITSLSTVIKNLTVLDLGYGNINKEAAVELAMALNCNNILKQLWLRGNVLGADGAAVILSSLQNIRTLRVLDLSYNNISSRSANGIAAVINSNHFLEQLWLDGNMLMTTGVVIIASALKKHSNLTLLSLSNNEITEDAAEEISAIVNSNTLLGGLLLSNNQLQSIGICKSFEEKNNLQVLELSNNCFNVDKLEVILSSCDSLKQLYLGNNDIRTTGAVTICQLLKGIHILEALSLNNNNITTEAASEICNVINKNINLDILLLGGNDLQTSGVLQIADTVKKNNPTMQLLSLSDNNVDEQVKEDIKLMLCDQHDLKLSI